VSGGLYFTDAPGADFLLVCAFAAVKGKKNAIWPPYLVRLNSLCTLGHETLTLTEDDKILMIWNLLPDTEAPPSPVASSASPELRQRKQPTVFPHAFPHALTSVDCHPSSAREVLVGAADGALYLTDWRADPVVDVVEPARHSYVTELVHPRAMADGLTGGASRSGSAAWRNDTM
jgi:hypothetical protein